MQSSAKDRISDWQWPNLAERGQQLLESRAECVREKPLTSVLSTFAVGFVVGAAIVTAVEMLTPEEPQLSRWERMLSRSIPEGWTPDAWAKAISKRFS